MKTYSLTLDQIISLVDNQAIEKQHKSDKDNTYTRFEVSTSKYCLWVRKSVTSGVTCYKAKLVTYALFRGSRYYVLDEHTCNVLYDHFEQEYTIREHEQYEERKGRLAKWLDKYCK
jgi:hypothetical protein